MNATAVKSTKDERRRDLFSSISNEPQSDGNELVTVAWAMYGDVDAVIEKVVARMRSYLEDPAHHFHGISVRWDGQNGWTYLCEVQYDDEGDS